MSRKHIQLIPGHTGGWMARDAGSRHGTLVNGKRLHDSFILNDGDELQLGEVRIIYRLKHPLDTASSRVAMSEDVLPPTVQASLDHQLRNDFAPVGSVHDLDQLRRDYEKLRLAQLLSTKLAGGSDLEPVLELVLRFCRKTLTVTQGVVLFRERDEDFKPKTAFGGDEDATVNISASVLKIVETEKRGVLVKDVPSLPDLAQADSIILTGALSILAVPIFKRDKVAGIIYLQNRASTHAFHEDDLRLLMGIAQQVSAALERDQLVRRLESARQQRERLARFLPPAVAEAVETGQLRLDGGGEDANITVLISDIRGFTPMSTKLGPRGSLALLNRYFEEMVDSVFRHHGTLDKYIGDGLVALWGAPTRDLKGAEHAIHCALDMQERIHRLNQDRDPTIPRIKVGIGVHTGPAIVGLLGAPRRLEYTAIGETVNIAARLCDIASPKQVLVSRATRQACPDKFTFTNEEPVALKGLEHQVMVSEVALTPS